MPRTPNSDSSIRILKEWYALSYSKPRRVKLKWVTQLLEDEDKVLSLTGGPGSSLISPLYPGFVEGKGSRKIHTLPQRIKAAVEFEQPFIEIAIQRPRQDRSRVGLTLRAFPSPRADLIEATGGKAYGLVSSWGFGPEELGENFNPESAEEMVEKIITVGERTLMHPATRNSGLAVVNLEGDPNCSFQIGMPVHPGLTADRIVTLLDEGLFCFDDPEDFINRVDQSYPQR